MENAVLFLRQQRQHMVDKITDITEYKRLALLMQPLTPVYFSCPGSPPCLSHRADFNDEKYTDSLRANRTLVKGRFQGGNVGYVFADELELYASAYRKEVTIDDRARCLLDLFRTEGPQNAHDIKQLSGMLVKEFMPVMHKLQEAFLVYEDQVDSDWERGWYLFADEFSNIDLNRYTKEEAIGELILRAVELLVFAEPIHLKGWLRLPVKEIKSATDRLVTNGKLIETTCFGQKGFQLACDTQILNQIEKQEPVKSVFVLHRSDFLVRAYEQSLKEQFGSNEILQYILIDGEFKGAVCGHWRQGPHDVEDIVLSLSENEKVSRKDEIISAVKVVYDPDRSPIKKYDGHIF